MMKSRAETIRGVAVDPSYAEDQPDANENMEMRFDDASISLNTESCSDRMINRLICSNARLAISTSTLRLQVLTLPDVWIPKAIPPDAPARTGFRGSVSWAFEDDRHAIILSDINMDGDEDLVVWSGPDGTYGDPSYTYFLYDAKTRRLVENTALAKLMEAHSLSLSYR